MKKKIVFLLALSVILAVSITMNGTLAYFTTYAESKGGYVIGLGNTNIKEEFSNWTHRVVVTNDEEGQAVYVRAKAFAGDQYTLAYSGEGWTLGEDEDGYYYYDQILNGGGSTEELLIRVENIPVELVPGDGFNVAVIYETTPVEYDADGKPYADWNSTLSGGAEE